MRKRLKVPIRGVEDGYGRLISSASTNLNLNAPDGLFAALKPRITIYE